MTAGLGNRILADHLGPDRELTHELVNWTKEQVGGAYGYELRVRIFIFLNRKSSREKCNKRDG